MGCWPSYPFPGSFRRRWYALCSISRSCQKGFGPLRYHLVAMSQSISKRPSTRRQISCEHPWNQNRSPAPSSGKLPKLTKSAKTKIESLNDPPVTPHCWCQCWLIKVIAATNSRNQEQGRCATTAPSRVNIDRGGRGGGE